MSSKSVKTSSSAVMGESKEKDPQQRRARKFIVGITAGLGSLGVAGVALEATSASESVAYAENGCPPGAEPTGNTTSWGAIVCQPIEQSTTTIKSTNTTTPNTQPTTPTTKPTTPTTKPAVTTTTEAPKIDSDKDGLLDPVEVYLGTNPNSADTDKDGVKDGSETLNADGSIKPNLDTDSDGKINPLESGVDVDGDGLSQETGDDNEQDPCIPDETARVCDADEDGLTNAEEAEKGTDPNTADTDGDGVPDDVDQQNKELADGESVDTNGVIIKVASTATTLPTSTSEQTTTTSPVSSSPTDDQSKNGESNGLLIGGPVGVGIVGLGVVIAILRKKRNSSKKRVSTSVA